MNKDPSTAGILAINHEYTDNNVLFADGDADWTEEQTIKEQNAHGVGIVSIRRGNGGWGVVDTGQRINNERLGVGGQGFGHQWATTDEQWRADLHPNRPNTFGWIVEIDPYDPKSTPKKHTSLGRFKHEAAVVGESNRGQGVVSMGDDQRFDYVYEFVSTNACRDDVAAGRSPPRMDCHPSRRPDLRGVHQQHAARGAERRQPAGQQCLRAHREEPSGTS